MSRIQEQVEQALRDYSPETRAALLGVLTSEPEYRAAVIGRLFEGDRAQQMRELLIDLEDDDVGRALVVAVLRAVDQGGPWVPP